MAAKSVAAAAAVKAEPKCRDESGEEEEWEVAVAHQSAGAKTATH